MYGATATRAQTQTHIRLRPPFRIVWSRGLGSLIEFPAVVDDGVAYIGNARATIRAISMRTGNVLWRHDTSHGLMASSLRSSAAQLVYHTMDGQVVVLDRATGRQLWAKWFGSPIESSPIVQDGIDYFGAWNGVLYALDLRTHRLRWTRSLGAKITSSAAIAGGTALHRRLRRAPLGALAPQRRDALGRLGERQDLRHARRARAVASSCRRPPVAR